MVSVIVTAYNSRQYLRTAVESIMRQTMRDIEIILVDDGSTDGTADLCDEMKLEDERIRVVHKKNGGEVSARKEGVKVARGNYIQFVDSDDWIEEKMVEDLLSLAHREKADLVASGWIVHKGGKSENLSEKMPVGSYRTDEEKRFFASNMIWFRDQEHGINGSLNTKLFSVDLLRRVLPLVPDSIVYAEDDFAAYSCCALAKCIVVTDQNYYHYITDVSVINESRNMYFLRDMNEGYLLFLKMTGNSPYFHIYKREIDKFLIRSVFYGLNKFMGIEKELYLPRYYFYTARIPNGAKVVLYGAGTVGKSFYQQLSKENRYSIVAWVDRDYKKMEEERWSVQSPDCLVNCGDESLYIIIAVKKKTLADTIREYLKEEFSFPEERIIWELPKEL